MRFIGITGGIGAGKSELLSYIKKHYRCEIYLADEVAHLVKQKGTEGYEKLVALMGEDILDATGEIDKKAMAERIFHDDALLAKVNAILHPAVRGFLLEKLALAQNNPNLELFFVEAALLIEAGYKDMVDELWYIHADASVRRKRLAANRGYTEEKITSIMGSQLSEEHFRRECDFVIDNSGDLAEAYRQIDHKLEAFSWQD